MEDVSFAEKLGREAKRRAAFLWCTVALVFVGMTIAAMMWQPASSVVNPPEVITYQGKLLEGGAAVTTTQSMQFRIYNESAGGQLVYTASGTVGVPLAHSITPSSGIFAVDLGDPNATIPTNAFDQGMFVTSSALYLEVRIGATTLSPRKKIGGVAYAINSRYLMGLETDTSSTSEYIPRSDSNGRMVFAGDPQGALIDQGSVYINPAAPDANETLFGVANGGLDRLRVDAEGDTFISNDLDVNSGVLFVDATNNRVGINSSTPEFPFGVVGNSWFTGDLTADAGTLKVDATNNRVGINSSTPAFPFGVVGNSWFAGDVTADSGTFKVDATNNRVGINSSTPAFPLSVVGSSFFSATATLPGLVIGSGGSGGAITLNGSTISEWPGGGGGDVTAAGNNTFTGTNRFNGATNFAGQITATGTVANFQGRIIAPTGTAIVSDGDNGFEFTDGEVIDVQGNLMYVGTANVFNDTNEFTIFDISNPASPVILGSVADGDDGVDFGFLAHLEVVGSYAYAIGGDFTTGDTIYSVIDVSDPSNPKVLDQVLEADNVLIDSPNGLYISGSYMYVGDLSGDSVIVVDISDPEDIEVVETLTDGDQGGDVQLNGVQDVTGSGTHLFVSSNVSDAVSIIDITDPLNIAQIAVIDDGVNGVDLENPAELEYHNGFLYVDATINAGNGVAAFRVSDPLSPTSTDNLNETDDTVQFSGVGDIQASGNYLYVSAITDDRITIIDISDPSTMTVVGTALHNTNGIALDAPANFVISGTHIYAVNRAVDNIGIIDIGGAEVSNVDAGSANLGALVVQGETEIGERLTVRAGIDITNNGLAVAGGIVMRNSTSTAAGTNSITFVDKARFFSTIATTTSSTVDNVFIFDTRDAFFASTTSYLVSVRNAGTPVFSVSADGDVHATGTFHGEAVAVATPGRPGDLAERVDIVPDEVVEPGDVLVVDQAGVDRYTKSARAYETSVAGVVSTKPTITVGSGRTKHTAVMAMVGRVPVKVSLENGPIETGDLLVSASKPGHAMKYDPAKDNGVRTVGIIGLALEAFDGEIDDEGEEKETGKILGLVRSGWMNNRHKTIAEMQQDMLAIADEVGVDIAADAQQLDVEFKDGVLGNVQDDVDFGGFALKNVGNIVGEGGGWQIDSQGRFVTNVETADGNKPIYALQSADTEFVISGSSKLDNGYARVTFDKYTRQIIDPEKPMKVSITLTKDAKGVFVKEKTSAGFVVKEVRNGSSDATFDWVVIASRHVEGVVNEIEDLEEEEHDEDEREEQEEDENEEQEEDENNDEPEEEQNENEENVEEEEAKEQDPEQEEGEDQEVNEDPEEDVENEEENAEEEVQENPEEEEENEEAQEEAQEDADPVEDNEEEAAVEEDGQEEAPVEEQEENEPPAEEPAPEVPVEEAAEEEPIAEEPVAVEEDEEQAPEEEADPQEEEPAPEPEEAETAPEENPAE